MLDLHLVQKTVDRIAFRYRKPLSYYVKGEQNSKNPINLE